MLRKFVCSLPSCYVWKDKPDKQTQRMQVITYKLQTPAQIVNLRVLIDEHRHYISNQNLRISKCWSWFTIHDKLLTV